MEPRVAPGAARHPPGEERRGTRAPRPALDIQVPVVPAAVLHRLDALLDDYEPFAISDGQGGDAPATAAGDAHVAPFLERRVYFFSARARDAAREAIHRVLGPDGARTTPIDVVDDGWAERSHAGLRAIQVGDLLVSPPWDAPPSTAGARTVVIIEPSMGFGTGHHASTRLCLLALQRFRDRLRTSSRVLDLGTGSGVLGIAAALLGAGTVLAAERDPDAVGNAQHNVRRNRVDERVTVLAGDLADLSPGTGDVVTANLTGAFFVRHAAVVLRCVAPGGLLLASGIAADEEQAARTALEPPLVLRERRTEDEWVGLVLERPAQALGPLAE